jgi:hypothetical protein
LSVGYVFGDSDRKLLEPSLLFQLVGKTKEKSIDLNIKAYKKWTGKFGSLLIEEEVLMAPNILMAFLNKTAIRYLIVGGISINLWLPIPILM